MEIRLARKELQTAFSDLNNADLTNVSIATDDFLDLVHSNTEILEVISSLPICTIDVEQWQKDLYSSQELELPRDKAERISLMLAVLEKNKKDLASVSIAFRVGSNKIIDHIRAYIDSMVRPIYRYVDGELHRKELAAEPVSNTSITATNAVFIGGNNYGSISQESNDTVRLLGELSDALQKSADLTDDQKLEVVSNIDTVKNQIVSSKPNVQIIKLAWQAVTAMANVSGATDLVAKIIPLLASYMGQS